MEGARRPVLGIAGAGLMGRGIAQVAVQAGFDTVLYDTRAGAADAAKDAIATQLHRLVEKGKTDARTAEAAIARVRPVASLADFAGCGIVIEAIVEDLEAKRELFRALERVVTPECILATNTSSLSVTAIAAACARPERVAGLHFFSPVPLMKVVEVIDGVRGDPEVATRLVELARAFGHAPVRAKDTPGFLVNHAGRAFGTEALRLLSEGVAEFHQIDDVLREAAGFRMGPFELLDLTGPGRLAAGDGIDLPPVLRGAALPPLAAARAAAPGRPARPQVRARLLSLRGGRSPGGRAGTGTRAAAGARCG